MGIVKRLFSKKDEPPPIATKEEADKQREAMLDAVKAAWIEGVLETSLYQKELLELDLEECRVDVEKCRDLIQPPVQRDVQTPKRAFQPSLRSTDDILAIFDDDHGRLLILGEPGSGKTITLLNLANLLIYRARADSEYPLPVVFNLASWAEKQQPLAAWLIDELEKKYRVPKSLGRYWVEKRELLLLLDGLDEVREDVRGKCIEAINAYCGGIVKAVVCSRYEEYKAAISDQMKLAAWGVIRLKPLSKDNVFKRLTKLNEKAKPVKKALEEDMDLLKLAQTPLLLNVMLMAYGGEGGESQAREGTIEDKRSRLFDRYIRRVLLEHRTEKHLWPPSKVMTWVRWIAKELIQYNEIEFRLENLQPDWLQNGEIQFYRGINALIIGLISLLIVGLSVALSVRLGYGMALGLFLGLNFGLFFGVLNSVSEKMEREILPVRSRWNFHLLSTLKLSEDFLLQFFLLFMGLLTGLFIGQSIGLLSGLAIGLVIGLTAGLLSVLFFVLEDVKSIITSPVPNRPIWQSGKNGLLVALFGSPFLVLLIGPIATPFLLFDGSTVGQYGNLNEGLRGWLVIGLPFGISTGLLLGFGYGGEAFIRHWALRFTLWRYGHTPAPWRYVAFLDYAVQRILLRRVGGGWIFIHRMIMEHIAGLDDAFIASLDR